MPESVIVQWFQSGVFLLFLLHLLLGLLVSCKLELFLLICLFNININSEILFFLSRLFSHYLSVFTLMFQINSDLVSGSSFKLTHCFDTFLSFLEHFIPFETKDIPGSLSAFSATVLESAISSRSPGFFSLGQSI